MPFAVKQWPDEPDPRPPNYIIDGWDVGQLSSWKWILSTDGATGLMSVFNDGVQCHNTFHLPNLGAFAVDDTLPDDLALIFNINSHQTPQTGPPDWTVQIALQIFQLTDLLFTGLWREEYPTAIQIQGPIIMTPVSGTGGTFPNPMFAAPAKWNS